MNAKCFAAVTALAVVASLVLGDRARGDYNYSTAISITGVSAGTFSNTAIGATATFDGTTVTFTNVSRTGFLVPGINTINIGDVAVTTVTPPPASNSFSINYNDVFTLTNNPPPGFAGTGSFTLHGVVTLSTVNTGTGTVTNTYLPPSSASGTLGGVFFAGAADNFGNPTINGAAGNLGGTLSSAVPEPSAWLLTALEISCGYVLLFSRHLRTLATRTRIVTG
jgi:hypothetical protein